MSFPPHAPPYDTVSIPYTSFSSSGQGQAISNQEPYGQGQMSMQDPRQEHYPSRMVLAVSTQNPGIVSSAVENGWGGTGRVELVDVYTVTISDPEKRGEGINSYTVYRINTTVRSQLVGAMMGSDSNGVGTGTAVGVKSNVSQFSTQRRYNDFVWLRAQLVSEFPGVIVPPLPEKSIISKFAADFIDARRRGLEKFLNRTLAHPRLSKGEVFTVFLASDVESLERAKFSSKENEHKPAKGFFDYFSDISASIQSSLANPSEQQFHTPDDINCQSALKYATSLSTSIANAESNTESLLRRSKGLFILIVVAYFRSFCSLV